MNRRETVSTSACYFRAEYDSSNREVNMASRAPTQTKDCTFPHCSGRMILTSSPKIDPVVAAAAGEEPIELYWFWLCDQDQSHTERLRPDP